MRAGILFSEPARFTMDVLVALQSSKKSTTGLYAGPKEFVSSAVGRLAGLLDHEGIAAMAQVMVGSTDPMLLKRVAALWDNPAWGEFFARYAPLVSAWCSAYGLDAASVDELCQRVWVELARRMPSYQYDPGGSFRGWLRQLCRHRAIDLYRERRDSSFLALTDDDLIDERRMAGAHLDGEPIYDEVAPERLLLLREAREAQEEVRRKVKPVRWEIFWRVAIEGESMSETAHALGLKYSTVYAAVNHVARLLREEGRRRGASLGLVDSSSPQKG
jgi:RNA polymerase sigma factor (sigma-70 family)